MIEIWKPIPDFPGYEVSDQGRVRSYWKHIPLGRGSLSTLADEPQRFFGQYCGSSHYVQIRLYKGRKGYNRRLHHLVLEVFVGPRPKGMEACHNDGDRKNNHLSNLRWDTRKNNIHDKVGHGTAPIGEKHGGAKLTEDQVIEIRHLYKTGKYYHRDIAAMFKVTPSTIGQIIRRQHWTHI